MHKLDLSHPSISQPCQLHDFMDYKHATTNLAISSNVMSQDKLSKADSLVQSSRYKTIYIKTYSFLHARFSELIKVVENLLRKAYVETLNYWKDICCRYTLELPL